MANRFWVGNAGTWDASSTTHWSATSGGSAGASAPSSTDDVFFDANSFSLSNEIVVISGGVCRNFNSTGVTNSPDLSVQSPGMSVYGSWLQTIGLSFISVADIIYFRATTTGHTISDMSVYQVVFDGIGGEWTLQDTTEITLGGGGGCELIAGTLVLNGQTLQTTSFSISGSDVKVLTLDSGTIYCSFSFVINDDCSNLTINKGTSTISTGNGPFGSFENNSTQSFEFYNVEAYRNVRAVLHGCTRFNNLTIEADSSQIPNPSEPTTLFIPIYNDITFDGTLTLTGNNQAFDRIFMQTDVPGLQRTLTANTVALTNTDFIDIIGAGGATWSGTSIGDGGNCTNFTFTLPTTRYWVGNEGSWYDVAHWSATSGGVGGATSPLCHDTVIFDSSSFSLAGQRVLAPIYTMGKDIDWSGVTNNPTWELKNSNIFIREVGVFGDLTLSANMTLGGSNNDPSEFCFTGRENTVYTSNGQTIFPEPWFGGFADATIIDKGASTLTVSADTTFGILHCRSGIFDAGIYNITLIALTTGDFPGSGTGTDRETFNFTLNMGTGIWDFTPSLPLDSAHVNPSIILLEPEVGYDITINKETANIEFNLTGFEYSQPKISNYKSLTFNDLTITGNNSSTLAFEQSDALTFGVVTISNMEEIEFTSGQTLTTTKFIANGFMVSEFFNFTILLTASTPGDQAFLYSEQEAEVTYLNVTDNHALGNIPFYDIPGGVDGGNNTNWIFNLVSNEYIQNTFLVGIDPAGDVQTINAGKDDDGTPIYFELETQDLEFGNASHFKEVSDKIVIFSKDGQDSQISVKADQGNYNPVQVELLGRVNIGQDIDVQGKKVIFKWAGETRESSPVLEGISLTKITDKGMTNG